MMNENTAMLTLRVARSASYLRRASLIFTSWLLRSTARLMFCIWFSFFTPTRLSCISVAVTWHSRAFFQSPRFLYIR